MNTELDRLARNKGFGSLSDLAKAMNRTPAVFFSNLTYFSKTLNYKSRFAKDLLTALNMTESEFVEEIVNNKSTLVSEKKISTEKILERKAILFSNMESSQHEDLLSIIESLSEGDIYISVSSKRPLETTSQVFQETIIKAVLKGVLFRYVVTEVKVSFFTDGLQEFEDHFIRDLEARCNLMYGRNKMKIAFKESVNFISGASLNFSPIHSYIIIVKDASNYVLEMIRTGKSYMTRNEEASSVWHPLPGIESTYIINKLGPVLDKDEKDRMGILPNMPFGGFFG